MPTATVGPPPMSNTAIHTIKIQKLQPLGGDCANFASQILYEGGKFKQTGAWRYEKDGSKAWVNAHAFNSYMLYSGRGSLIARGTYNQVFKASFKLLPGTT